MKQINEDHHTVFHLSSPATPSTDYSTITEDTTPEPIALDYPNKIATQNLTNSTESTCTIPRKLFLDEIDNDKLFGTNFNEEEEMKPMHTQILAQQQQVLVMKVALRTSDELSADAIAVIIEKDKIINRLEQIIIEKDEFIDRLKDILQQETLKEEVAREVIAEKQEALDDAVQISSHLEDLLQKEKLREEAAREVIAEKQVELDEATDIICASDLRATKEDHRLNRIINKGKQMLDELEETVTRRDNSILKLKSMLRKVEDCRLRAKEQHDDYEQQVNRYIQQVKEADQRRDQREETHQYVQQVQTHQYVQKIQSNHYVQQTISNYSGGRVQISSGGGGCRWIS
jgi:hypothetical protein